MSMIDEETKLEESVEEVEAEAVENPLQEKVDLLMRALAEKENRVKIIERERDVSVKYAAGTVLADFLEVLDALDSALQVGDGQELTGGALTLREGLVLTRSLASKILEKHGVVEISPEPGDAFDHDLHQAMSQVESEDYEGGAIVQCLRKGFKLKDRLLRPSFVVVAQEKN